MLIDILQTFLKSVISVIILFVLTRVMGKKQLSQLTFFDYVVGISIGSVAAAFAVDPSIDYTRGITALVVYAIFPIALSLIALKSYKARKLLDGKPTILVYHGQLIEDNLKKTKLTVNDVLEECRLQSVFNFTDVEFVILETDGRFSVEKKDSYRPLTPKDMGVTTARPELSMIVVADGEILDDHLAMSGRNRDWLKDELIRQGVADSGSVLLAYIDSGGQLNIQKKGSPAPMNPLI
jgi:uncharacterized membrane protein YcaP (DUF421 family)